MYRQPSVNIDKLLNPHAKPSIPSIKLIALTMNTVNKMVKGIPSQGVSSSIPKRPYRLLIHRPDKGIREAAMICTTNLLR